MRDLFTEELNADQADQIFNDYFKCYSERWSIYDDVIECLELLEHKGYRLGNISNGDFKQQVEKLKKTGIHQYFKNNIYTSSEIGIPKPAQGIFVEACRLAGVTPETSCYIGDR